MSRPISRATAVLVCCVAVAAGACSKKVDASSVESQVVDKIKEEFPKVGEATADCPGGLKAEKGRTFTCKVTLDGQKTDVKIRILDVKDKRFTFRPEATEPIYDMAKLTGRIKQQFSATAVDCGTKPVRVERPGNTIRCKVTVAGGRVQTLKLRVKNSKGELDPVQ